MPDRWTVRFAPEAMAEQYRIPRGEAAVFRDAITPLFDGPEPEGYESVADVPDVFEYRKNGYRIVYEVHRTRRTIRIILFERE